MEKERNNGGSEALLSVLQQFDLTDFEVRDFPDTPARQEQKYLSMQPLEAWWRQVLDATKEKGIPALVYKFDRRPIKVRVPIGAINPELHIDSPFNADLLWDDFIFLLKVIYLFSKIFFYIIRQNIR